MKQPRSSSTLIALAFTVFCWEGCQTSPERQLSIPRVDTVYISMMKFRPEVLRVNKSDTVVWVNQDLVKHDVSAYPDGEWTSGPIPAGSSWKMVVSDSLSYFCSIHPTMKGKIKMKAP